MGFETLTSGVYNVPHLCWFYNSDIQQELIGVRQCAIDMLKSQPTDGTVILLVAHSSDSDCRACLGHLQHVTPISKVLGFYRWKQHVITQFIRTG